MKKPRVRFCWECGRNLRGRHHIEAEYQGHSRVMHKCCYKTLTGLDFKAVTRKSVPSPVIELPKHKNERNIE